MGLKCDLGPQEPLKKFSRLISFFLLRQKVACFWHPVSFWHPIANSCEFFEVPGQKKKIKIKSGMFLTPNEFLRPYGQFIWVFWSPWAKIKIRLMAGPKGQP